MLFRYGGYGGGRYNDFYGGRYGGGGGYRDYPDRRFVGLYGGRVFNASTTGGRVRSFRVKVLVHEMSLHPAWWLADGNSGCGLMESAIPWLNRWQTKRMMLMVARCYGHRAISRGTVDLEFFIDHQGTSDAIGKTRFQELFKTNPFLNVLFDFSTLIALTLSFWNLSDLQNVQQFL
uniref:Uncharacterized protein n=1 Tax=Parascaris equorum TaxID=6256 RepID=A0A914S1P6_PAREQ